MLFSLVRMNSVFKLLNWNEVQQLDKNTLFEVRNILSKVSNFARIGSKFGGFFFYSWPFFRYELCIFIMFQIGNELTYIQGAFVFVRWIGKEAWIVYEIYNNNAPTTAMQDILTLRDPQLATGSLLLLLWYTC